MGHAICTFRFNESGNHGFRRLWVRVSLIDTRGSRTSSDLARWGLGFYIWGAIHRKIEMAMLKKSMKYGRNERNERHKRALSPFNRQKSASRAIMLVCFPCPQ